MIRFYPDRPTFADLGSRRGLDLMCLSVWPFDRPSRSTGSCVIRFSRTYWLVTVSGFQGSSAAGTPLLSCGFTHRQSAVRFGRRVNTLLIALAPVNSFFRRISGRLSDPAPETEERLPDSPEGASTDGEPSPLSGPVTADRSTPRCGSSMSTSNPVPIRKNGSNSLPPARSREQ